MCLCIDTSLFLRLIFFVISSTFFAALDFLFCYYQGDRLLSTRIFHRFQVLARRCGDISSGTFCSPMFRVDIGNAIQFYFIRFWLDEGIPFSISERVLVYCMMDTATVFSHVIDIFV